MQKLVPVLLVGLLLLSSCNTQSFSGKDEKEPKTIQEVTKSKQDKIEEYNNWLTTYIDNYGKAVDLFYDWAEKPKTGDDSSLEECLNIFTNMIEEVRGMDPPLSKKEGHSILLKSVDAWEEFVNAYPVKGSVESTNKESWDNFFQKFNQAQITSREYDDYLDKNSQKTSEGL